jgi:flagellar basal-body rod modification protein FlgD
MISGISGLPYFEEENLYTDPEEDKLGRDAFMKLFLAQMNHQDPLNPMDTSQFGSQLAQFSTLEQLYNANENLESIKGIQSEGNKYNALGLMGKEVQAQSDSLLLRDDSQATGAFYIDTAAEGCIVRIYDEKGKAVKDIDMEELWAGTHTFEWDGRDEDGNKLTSGIYHYSVSAVSPEGDMLPVEEYIEGPVTRVSLFEEEPVIYVNEIPMNMEQIVNIKVKSNETSNNETES